MTESIAGLAKTLNDLYAELGTWELVGKRYGVTRTIAWRIAKEGYEPKKNKIRRLFGLSEIIEYKIRRNAKGRFTKDTG